jgi:isopenicillin N synthase-like dioxygenase
MGYSQARQMDADQIPVVDITPLRDGSDPLSVARALHAASTGLGFIYIKGHGIPDDVIANCRTSAYEFFHADPALKETVRVSSKHRGWLGQGGAKMQDEAKADLKESFIWGYQDKDGQTPEDHPLRGPNQWPDFLPDLQTSAMTYFEHAHGVAHYLMQGFAIGLGLEPDFFLRTASRPLSRASFVFYPPQPAEMGQNQFGVGPHTDFGVLTVLCQDSVGGLQVQDSNGDWVEAPPIEGTLIVNVADLLARWTNGAYKSTPHRVVNASGRERLSLVLAFDPDPDTMIDARQIYREDAGQAEPPITCGDYLVWRFAKAFAYRKAE